jgi:hypothetical protein
MKLKQGNNARYTNYPLSAAAAAALRKGENTIAIHVNNGAGKESQYFDVEINDESINW